MDFVSQQYWDESYKNFAYHVAHDEVTAWIEKQAKFFSFTGRLFEFGCFPGRYLSFLGKQGWTVNGIDMTAAIAELRFRQWLQQEGIKSEMIVQGDALAYAAETNDRYDLVCSFGFIEHFEDFLNVIDLHDRLLNENGWLMITTPNFRGGVQKFFHETFNKQALNIHFLPSMQPTLWKQKLEERGYAVKESGYFGGFDFWYDAAERSAWQNLALKLIRKTKRFIKNLPDNAAYSPYCGIIAQKPAK